MPYGPTSVLSGRISESLIDHFSRGWAREREGGRIPGPLDQLRPWLRTKSGRESGPHLAGGRPGAQPGA